MLFPRFTLVLILIFMLLGCSSSSQDPVSPITPDDSHSWRDADSLSIGTDTSEKFWNDRLLVKDEIWVAHRNPNGSVHYALGPGVDVSTNPFDVIDMFPNLFLLSPDEFRFESDSTHAGIRIIKLRQYYNDLRVWPSLVTLVYGRGGKLVKTMGDVYPIGKLNTTPSITESQALSIVFDEIGETELETSSLAIYGTWEKCYLAYRIKTPDWIHYINALDGSVLHREHLVWDAEFHFEGTVRGYASQPDWYAPQELYEFSHVELRVRRDPSEFYPTSYLPRTDIDGYYQFWSDESQLEAEFRFFGPWMNQNNVDNYPFNEVSFRRDILAGEPEEWILDDSNSLRDERSVWFWSNHAWDYMKKVDPTGTEMDFRLLANVQNRPLCNAYASSRAIHFFKESSGCLNLGEICDVIVHEWGHVHQYEQYGVDLPEGMMREGNSDITANTICDHPFIGWGARGVGDYFRNSDNDLKWPLEECNGQVHCMGRLIAGAFWDLRQIVGREYHDYLWHFSKYLLPQTFQTWGADVIIIDDDDDNPLNGSPNYEHIYECWTINHNLEIPLEIELPTEGVVIDVVPHNPQIRIDVNDPEKKFSYNLRIRNLDDEMTYVQIWVAVELPWNAIFGPIIPPDHNKSWPVVIPVQPEQTLEFDLTQTLPEFTPPGEYRYRVRIGEYVDNVNDIIQDDASFRFWIID